MLRFALCVFLAAIVRSRRGAREFLPDERLCWVAHAALYSGVPIRDSSFGIGQTGPAPLRRGQASVAICSRSTALTPAMPVAF